MLDPFVRDEAVGRRGIAVFAAGSLESVKTETDVWSINLLDDFPYILPSWPGEVLVFLRIGKSRG